MGRPIERVTAVEQGVYPVPNIPVKELLGAIPYVAAANFFSLLLNGPLLELTVSNVPPCGRRYTCEFRSMQKGTFCSLLSRVWDAFVIWCFYKATTFVDPFIDTPNPFLYHFLKVALWSLYGFWAGLFGTGLWVIGHECGHQSFSASKVINNTVGWVVHSGCVYF
jgi:omega-6 fatty acid desaturase (delta-12 desaturase)